jgi:hypothetical protein
MRVERMMLCLAKPKLGFTWQGRFVASTKKAQLIAAIKTIVGRLEWLRSSQGHVESKNGCGFSYSTEHHGARRR